MYLQEIVDAVNNALGDFIVMHIKIEFKGHAQILFLYIYKN